VSLGIAHLNARNASDLANKKTIADVWAKLPPDVKAGVEERLGAFKCGGAAGVAETAAPAALPYILPPCTSPATLFGCRCSVAYHSHEPLHTP
jgi:hypothetical protein